MPDVLAVLRWSVDERLPQSEADVTVWIDTGSQWIGNCKAGHWRVYGEPKGQVTHWARWPLAGDDKAGPLGDVLESLRQCIDDQRRGMDVLASDACDRVREAWDRMEAE